MTDTTNCDKTYGVHFDFYIELGEQVAKLPYTETEQKNMSGRIWEITLTEPKKISRPQMIFAAKSGKLFNQG